MNYLLFPCVYGISGYFANKKTSCVLTRSGNYKLQEEKHRAFFNIYNVIFIRGIFYLISGFFIIFFGLFEFEKIYSQNSSNALKKAENSLNISSKTLFIFCIIIISLITSLIVLGFVPIKLSQILLNNSNNMLLRKVLTGAIKLVLLYVIFLTLRLLPAFNEYIKFNGAIESKGGEKVNYLTFFVSSCFVSTFALAFLGMSATVWYFFLVNICITVFCFGIVYEVFVLSSTFVWIKSLFLPFKILVYKNPSQNETKCVNIVLSEINLNSNKRDKAKVSEQESVSFSECFVNAKDILQKANKYESSDLDFIFAEVLNKNRAEIKLIKSISSADYKKILNAVKRRANGEPITKIFNHANFYGLDFYVNNNVLSPRQDTERLVETALKHCNKKTRVLDIGAGSGAISVCIAKFSGASVTAVDIDDKALQVAQKNALANGVKINFKKSDIYSALKKEKFNIIVSNPPYIPSGDIDGLDEEVKNYDPLISLDGGDDGLHFYRKIIEGATKYLVDGGMIFLEVGIGQAKDVKKLLQKNFKDIRIVKDYNKIDRVVYGKMNSE